MTDEIRFEGKYKEWRDRRIMVLEEIFAQRGIDVSHSRILEFGAGGGDTGAYFKAKGAEVVVTEGREQNFNLIREKHPDLNAYVFDNDTLSDGIFFGSGGSEFNIIIHWGLLYHLNNWQQDLARCRNLLPKGGLLCLESELLNGMSDQQVKVFEEDHWDQAVNRIGTRMTATSVQSYLNKLNFTYVRYDDSRLNLDFHRYNWNADPNFKIDDVLKVYGRNELEHGLRRFWVCKYHGKDGKN